MITFSNSVDPDQMAPLRNVWSGPALFKYYCKNRKIPKKQKLTLSCGALIIVLIKCNLVYAYNDSQRLKEAKIIVRKLKVFQYTQSFLMYTNMVNRGSYTWVVSWDQQFLNEFNKVLFSEPVAS